MKTNLKRYLKAKNRTNNVEEHEEVVLSSTDLASHDDILTEILLRLPIRALVRSKCVSKHWQSLISDTRFALLRNPNPNLPRGLFLRRIGNNGNAATPDYEFVPFDRDLHVKPPFKTLNFGQNASNSNPGIVVLHSSNGLLLCYSLHEQFSDIEKTIEYNATYYVYNPTINEVITLPTPEGYDWNERRPRCMVLAFDPSKSPHYKVVCVRGHSTVDYLYTIEIYSSETRAWKMISKSFANQVDTEFMGGVYWNDAVHWINKRGYVFYLKLDEEQFERIPTPIINHSWNLKQHCYPLIESSECLLLLDIFPPSTMKLDIHELSRDYTSWSAKYSVDLNQVLARFPDTDEMSRAFSFIGVLQRFVVHSFVVAEREEDSFLVVEVLGKAIRYNVVSETFEELCDLDASKPSRLFFADDGFSKFGRWPCAFLFFESLLRV